MSSTLMAQAANEIEKLRAENAGLHVDLDGESNWDTLCHVANRWVLSFPNRKFL
jgi:hypothetical protein